MIMALRTFQLAVANRNSITCIKSVTCKLLATSVRFAMLQLTSFARPKSETAHRIQYILRVLYNLLISKLQLQWINDFPYF